MQNVIMSLSAFNWQRSVPKLQKEAKKCNPTCKYFRCGQKALYIKRPKKGGRGKNRPLAHCNWADDLCSGSECGYALCTQRKMRSDGICALSISQRTSNKISKPIGEPDLERDKWTKAEVQMKNKVLKRIKSKNYLDY